LSFGVPFLADDVRVAGLALDHDDLVVLAHALVIWVHEDLAEAARERFVLLGVEFLVVEENDAVIEQRLADVGDHAVIELVADPDALDLGAAGAGDRVHLDPAVAHHGLLK
jgi:hypothetical protein